ncbi:MULTISPECIES: pyridoxamine 5'-phosphate oxidase family protein [unclassified Dehalobacter]|uniref:pyridoxamine 5'-phosphate oxidase family protein n=1 Tax=unclassified Dehalobacter TaxID=2635733 RepID=UPI000E6D3800|nr:MULTISPECIES: pyridoxamine 5'-phosphate oxidase family protein [unclassified Dehalobacter]RJE48412.1 NimC/NimA family protein [Dehalobacter sp. MCB1]TCX50481.1 NimC/NimA family protein [Dehalobacter sp. 14DCB1]TCX52279.1 NimC/NimA family protein [Dehalobacter sp. 12DCB1]
MKSIAQFLSDAKTFYLATADGDQPHVRPFGAVAEYDGKTYICTNNQKNVFAQLLKNPKVEISGMVGDKWIRLVGKVAVDPRPEAREAMFEANPSLRNMYKCDDGLCEVLYFTEATASIHSFTADPVEFTI